MRIASVGTAYPPHRYAQNVIADALRGRWEHKMEEPRLLNRLFANCGVDYRHTVFPLEHYPSLDCFEKTNTAWIKAAVELGQQSICKALDSAGVSPEEIGAIFFAS